MAKTGGGKTIDGKAERPRNLLDAGKDAPVATSSAVITRANVPRALEALGPSLRSSARPSRAEAAATKAWPVRFHPRTSFTLSPISP